MITPSHAFLVPPPSMRKTYLSMSMSRAWGAEMPIGDPFGGPAYGEKNAPVIAVAAAIGSISAGAAAIAAGSMLVGGAMIAGGVLSIAGTVSGNSKLSKIGGLLSLAGGIGGYMTDAWATTASNVAEGAQLAGGAEGATAAAAPTEALAYTPQADYQNLISQGIGADQAAMISGYTPGGAEMAGMQVGGPISTGAPAGVNLPPLDQSAMANVGMGGPLPPGGPAAAPVADMGFGGAAPNLGAPAMPAPAGDGLIGGAMTPPAAPAAAAPAASSGADAAFTARTVTGLPAVPGDAGTTAPGFFDSLKAGNYMDAAKAAGSATMDLAKSNPGAALMLGNAASGVADALSGKTGAQIDQAEAAAAYYNAKAEEAKRELEEKEARRRRLNEGFMTVDARLPGNLSSNILTMNQPQPQGQGGNVITPQFTMIPTQGLITSARRPTTPTRPGGI